MATEKHVDALPSTALTKSEESYMVGSELFCFAFSARKGKVIQVKWGFLHGVQEMSQGPGTETEGGGTIGAGKVDS